MRVCVIGVGPSGITALKNLVDEGLEVVAYDRNREVGGNWIFSEKESHSSVFETTHIISSKTLSQYEDFPFEEFDSSIPDYPSHQQLAAYFQAYARKFNLYSHIQFQTEVVSAERLAENNWAITIQKEGVTSVERFTHLVVCNGHHWNPRMPKFDGEFTGQFIHSHHYKKAEPFRGKRVLVIGGGNSACDVAVETSRVSTRTDISWRRGYRIVPKFIFGKPTDKVNVGMDFIPRRIRSFFSERLLDIIIGKNKLYGLQEPEHKFAATHPTVNDELLYKIRHGKVHPRVNIQRFDGETVFFVDGSQADFDTIIACTGFIITHPFFDKSFIDYSEGAVPLWLKMMHPVCKDLYFVGLFQPLGCIWPLAELQAKLMANEIIGKYQRPENIAQRIDKEINQPHYKQINTPRHTITVDYHRFKKELKRELRRREVK